MLSTSYCINVKIKSYTLALTSACLEGVFAVLACHWMGSINLMKLLITHGINSVLSINKVSSKIFSKKEPPYLSQGQLGPEISMLTTAVCCLPPCLNGVHFDN